MLETDGVFVLSEIHSLYVSDGLFISVLCLQRAIFCLLEKYELCVIHAS
jgi:hypothetical protein